MATLHISEAASLGEDGRGKQIPVFPEPARTTQAVTFTTATQSSAFGKDTRFIRIYSTAACHIAFGSNPTATASSPKYAGETEYFRVVNGGDKLSVYDGVS